MRVALLCAVPRFHQLQSVSACEGRCVGAKLTIYQLVLQVEFMAPVAVMLNLHADALAAVCH